MPSVCFKEYLVVDVVLFACTDKRGVVSLELKYVECVPVISCEQKDVGVVGPTSYIGDLNKELPLQLFGFVDDVVGEVLQWLSVDNGL